MHPTQLTVPPVPTPEIELIAPIATDETKWLPVAAPVTVMLVPVAAPIFGVVNDGLVARTTLPVPVEVAATASEGAEVGLVTVGTSHAGQLADGAEKLLTDPELIAAQPVAFPFGRIPVGA